MTKQIQINSNCCRSRRTACKNITQLIAATQSERMYPIHGAMGNKPLRWLASTPSIKQIKRSTNQSKGFRSFCVAPQSFYFVVAVRQTV